MRKIMLLVLVLVTLGVLGGAASAYNGKTVWPDRATMYRGAMSSH